MPISPLPSNDDIEAILKQSKNAFYQMVTLSSQQKNQALEVFAEILENNVEFLLAENQKDIILAEQERLSQSLYQRLKLDRGKIAQLIQGLRDLNRLPNPAGQVLSVTKLDQDLILEKVSVPLGVIGIIFESRPDVMPQVLSLILKSGNVVVLKGGREARHSNAAFMYLVKQLTQACDFLPPHWATLLESREAIYNMLQYPQYIDLVIPRGSNQMVQSIINATKIPVLGHADGVCHLYVHASANLSKATSLVLDAKTQYPAACNALETLLVDEIIAATFLPALLEKADQANLTLRGCSRTQSILPQLESATEEDWQTEYGDLTLAIKVVSSREEAAKHINRYGSHHTDAILAEDPKTIEWFLNAIDSACVFANASTRFADGFRFGFGAEIGISTAKTHARGPVGLEGLVIYKYKLRGQGHLSVDYIGENAKPFIHERL